MFQYLICFNEVIYFFPEAKTLYLTKILHYYFVTLLNRVSEEQKVQVTWNVTLNATYKSMLMYIWLILLFASIIYFAF